MASKEDKHKLSTHVEEDAYQRINVAAAIRGISVGAVISHLANQYLPEIPADFIEQIHEALPSKPK